MATFRYCNTFIDEVTELQSEFSRSFSRSGSKSCPQLGSHQSLAKNREKPLFFLSHLSRNLACLKVEYLNWEYVWSNEYLRMLKRFFGDATANPRSSTSDLETTRATSYVAELEGKCSATFGERPQMPAQPETEMTMTTSHSGSVEEAAPESPEPIEAGL